MTDYLTRGDLASVDPEVAELIRHEHARQFAKLIMIPSESSAPAAVREAEGSVLQNLYAEGYPHADMHGLSEAEILDYDLQLAFYRRYADRRYYKGVEYCNLIEELCKRRGAEAICPPGLSPDQLYLNVQPLAGAVANTAVYEALVNEGDTVMGLNLLHGGHLSHGSPVNHSGKHHRMVFYEVDEKTELLDYDRIREIALREKPKMIIAGYTSYPWAPDFHKFRQIADECGAYLMADISHVAGLAITGVYPNPVGVAHVTTFTTHKTLLGPRGAVIVTTDPELARKIDRAVFPGEQGGPHMNKIAGIAVAFKLARSESFRRLQQQIVANAMALAQGFADNGLRVVHGGTDTHMALIDCRTAAPKLNGVALMGDAAARILDLANIVCNRNTIPGDRDATRPSALRFGTPWVTQRGLNENDMREIAAVVAQILKTAKPFTLTSARATTYRAKVDFDALLDGAARISRLCEKAGVDVDTPRDDYPHAWTSVVPVEPLPPSGLRALEISGEHARAFLQLALTSDVSALAVEETQPAWVLERDGSPMSPAIVLNAGAAYRLAVPADKIERVARWLRALSDGYVQFDEHDVYAKLPGPVIVKVTSAAGFDARQLPTDLGAANVAAHKPYFIGKQQSAEHTAQTTDNTPQMTEQSGALRRTALYETHKAMGARMVPFGGWDMPVWYTSASEEHQAVRKTAGLFDVSHMGVLDARGPNAAAFLDAVSTNDVLDLKVGGSQYSYLLDTAGNVIDDIMIYRIAPERYLIVVNAANNDKDWAWLTAVNAGRATIDPANPTARAPSCELRDLRDPASGEDRRVDFALQGPASLPTLLALLDGDEARHALRALPRTGVMRATLAGLDVFISRTGYTGESVAYETFVHPERSVALWQAILKAGEPFGVKPAGLAARDSTRTEAGLPLYGHELAGPLNLAPFHIGFGGYVKAYKPFFIGKHAYYQRAAQANTRLSRFRMNEKGVRPPKQGDPVVDARGRVIGTVTSCALDTEGYLLGMAMLDAALNAKEGMAIGVLALPERPPVPLTPHAPLGSRTLVPEPATVLTRFPKKAK